MRVGTDGALEAIRHKTSWLGHIWDGHPSAQEQAVTGCPANKDAG